MVALAATTNSTVSKKAKHFWGFLTNTLDAKLKLTKINKTNGKQNKVNTKSPTNRKI